MFSYPYARSREALASKNAGGTLRHVDEGIYKKVVERLQLSRLLEDPQVVDKLAQAGFRGPRPVSTFYFFRFVLPFAFAALRSLRKAFAVFTSTSLPLIVVTQIDIFLPER